MKPRAADDSVRDLNVWAFHVVTPVSMSVDAAMDRIADRVAALKAETSGSDDGGRWCHTGKGGGFTLDGRSFGSALFDLQQALSSKSGSYVPSDWYPDYRFATVKSDVVVDLTQ